MCFSATASFLAAGVTGAIGVVAIARTRRASEAPLAAAPLIFAAQQGIEGLLWLNLMQSPDGGGSQGLATLFLFFAEAFWPIYAPVAVLLIEPRPGRRRLLHACLAAGAAVGGYLFWGLLTLPHGAALREGHIVYFTETRQSNLVAILYLASTALPLALSSRRTVQILGAIVFVGAIVAYVSYWEAFVSVWCFFAAVASATILFHFERSRRTRIRSAVA